MPVAVSIVLPTYNRAQFLPDAIGSIRNQEFPDWELVVVDDGSADETPSLVAALTEKFHQPVRYIRQQNGGAYAARNTGLDHAFGKYVAFYDSDDLWLPHHLRDCVSALDEHEDVDWVYAACRLVDSERKKVIAEDSFRIDGQERPFMSLPSRSAGSLHVIESSDAVRCQILHGLYCGLQSSVIRRSLFAQLRLPPYAVGEDQILVIQALSQGFKLAYIDQVNVDYRIHGDNTAGTSEGSPAKQRAAIACVIAAHEDLLHESCLSFYVRLALRQRLAKDYFWLLGYSGYWMHGDKQQALKCMKQAIGYWPWSWRLWRTYCACLLRPAMSRSPSLVSK